MNTSIKYSFSLLALLILSVMPVKAIENYKNDPALKRALYYDSEQNGGDRKISNQKLAEKYYLEYLTKEENPFIRTQVYTQLGVLFNTNWHAEKGEKPDYKKARGYFKLALEAEPTRIGVSTIRARLGSLTPDLTPEERLLIRISIYKWILEKENKPFNKNNYIKTNVNLKKYLNDIKKAENTNIINEANLSSDKFKSFQLIHAEIPNTIPAEFAKEYFIKNNQPINKTVTKNIETETKELEKNEPDKESAILKKPKSQSHKLGNEYTITKIMYSIAIVAILIILAFIIKSYKSKATK